MKWNFLLLLLGAMGMLAFQSTQPARSDDEKGAELPACEFAVLDMSLVFKQCESFNAEMATMKAAVELADAELAEERKKINDRVQEAEIVEDAAEAKEEKASLVRDKAEFNIKVSNKRAEFLERESQIYLSHHQRIKSIVDKFAKERGIRLVIRMGTDQYAKPTRDEILKMINAPIVFHDQIDITQDVLLLVNQKEMSSAQ